MSLANQLESGELGVRLELPSRFETVAEEPRNLHVVDAESGVAWWFLHFPGLLMDLGDSNRDFLREALKWPARVMFDDLHSQMSDGDEPRTADASWSPLIEAEFLSLRGAAALRTVHRMVYVPGNEMIMGHILVPLRTGLFEARALTRNHGPTGLRASALMMLQMDDDDEPSMPSQSFFDDEKHDAKFPEHPLSRLRGALRWVTGPEGLEPLDPAPQSDGNARVRLEDVGCSFDAPPCMDPDTLARVLFCGTDGVQRLIVERLSETGTLEEIAHAHARALHEREQVENVDVDCQTIDAVPNLPVVVAVVTGDGHGGRLQNTMCYFEAGGSHWAVSLTTTRGIPRERVTAELCDVVRSFEAEPRKKKRLFGLF